MGWSRLSNPIHAIMLFGSSMATHAAEVRTKFACTRVPVHLCADVAASRIDTMYDLYPAVRGRGVWDAGVLGVGVYACAGCECSRQFLAAARLTDSMRGGFERERGRAAPRFGSAASSLPGSYGGGMLARVHVRTASVRGSP